MFHIHEEQIDKEIDGLKAEWTKVSVLYEKIPPPPQTSVSAWDADHWQHKVYSYSLKKLAGFEHDERILRDSMYLLSITRYVVELGVWIRLISTNKFYALYYYYQQIQTLKHFYQNQAKHYRREAELFIRLAQTEGTLIEDKIQRAIANKSDEELKNSVLSVMAEMDAEAAKHFAVTTEECKSAGFGFQAHLLLTQAVPSLEGAMNKLESEEFALLENAPKEALDLIQRNKRLNWKDLALKAGMEKDYEFIYTYTSKLLHATPASITTADQKLSNSEVYIFVRYISYSIRDLIATIEDTAVTHSGRK